MDAGPTSADAGITDAPPSGTVTFLFTDVVGSTELWERDPAAMARALEQHDRILRDAIRSYGGGVVFATAGDSFGAVFARASEAVVVAVDAQRSLTAANWPNGAPLRVRMGLHTGEAVERDGNYFGTAVNRAARMMSIAHGGQILCSLATRQVLADHLPMGLDLHDHGWVRLKGLSSLERAYSLLAEGLPSGFPPLESAGGSLGNLPANPIRPIGRDADVSNVERTLRDGRVVTLTGGGGVGKTTMALTAAAAASGDHPDGVWWVDLAALSDEQDVMSAIASSLGVRSQTGETLLSTTCQTIADRRLLLVLDNCEHVRAAVHEIVELIERTCTRATVLATSREPLGVAGEQVIGVRPLDVAGPDSPAVELVLERMGRPELRSDDVEMAAIGAICRSLDGVPLALELAAARCRAMRPTEVAARLFERFRLLEDPRRRVRRHRSLRATVEWSFDMLTSDERVLFARLSVFRGSFTLDQVEEICAAEHFDRIDVDASLASLVDKSLVEYDGHRYRLLDTSRTFAHERLEQSGEAKQLRDAHMELMVRLAREARLGLRGSDEILWVERLDADWSNMRAAFRNAMKLDDPSAAITLVTHLVVEGFFRRPEALTWAIEAGEVFGEADHPRRHELLGAAGWAEWAIGDLGAALRHGELGMALDPAPGTALDRLAEYARMSALAWRGDIEEATDQAMASLDTFDRDTDAWNEMFWTTFVMIGLINMERWTELVQFARRAAEAAIATGNATALAWTGHFDALAAAFTDPPRVFETFARARVLARSVRNVWVENAIIQTNATIRAQLDPTAQSVFELVDTTAELHRGGWHVNAASSIIDLALLLARLGRYEVAANLFGAGQGSPAAGMPVSRRILEEATGLLEQALGATALAALAAEGAHLSVSDLLARAAACMSTDTGGASPSD